MSVLIKNGRVITASDDYFADIYIENERGERPLQGPAVVELPRRPG